MNLSHSCSTHWQVEAHFLWLISSNIIYIHLQTASNGGLINIFQDVMETVNITTCSEHQPPSPHHHALPDVESNHVHHAGARHVIRWATSSGRRRRQHQLAGAPGHGHRIPQDTTGCRKETRTNGHFHSENSEIGLWCHVMSICCDMLHSTPLAACPVCSRPDSRALQTIRSISDSKSIGVQFAMGLAKNKCDFVRKKTPSNTFRFLCSCTTLLVTWSCPCAKGPTVYTFFCSWVTKHRAQTLRVLQGLRPCNKMQQRSQSLCLIRLDGPFLEGLAKWMMSLHAARWNMLKHVEPPFFPSDLQPKLGAMQAAKKDRRWKPVFQCWNVGLHSKSSPRVKCGSRTLNLFTS